ncbi:hypothetical protein [Staphylococcus gallinarum]|uniref:hypothetical protein n=1 Tax=Staphylococcus gallinarum TaxID=1293 RepID=UPI0015FB38CB|nr:hypothetical protein [Staphylococcus gallinarum]
MNLREVSERGVSENEKRCERLAISQRKLLSADGSRLTFRTRVEKNDEIETV